MTGGRLNDSTRHLSAGVYLDPAYRDRLIREVYLDRSRRVAPSYGFDLEPVLIHARRALLQETACDLLLVGSVTAGLCLLPAPAIAALVVLVLWFVGRAAYRLVRDYVRYYFTRGSLDEYTHLQQRLRVLKWVWRGLTIVPIVLMAGILLMATRHVVSPTSLRPSGFRHLLQWTAAILAFQTMVVVACATAIHFFIRSLRADAREPLAVVGPRLMTVARQQKEPITIYSRFRPFIGSGIEVRTWSFVQRLVQARSGDPEGEREWDTPPFRTADIVRYLALKISSLASDPDTETRLPGLTVKDHIFVAGTRTADLPEEIATAEPIHVMANPSGHARHYLACQIDSWGGEIVTTVYVHASIQGRMLYLEFSTRALPPTREEFHVTDEPGGVGGMAYLRTVGKAVGSLPTRVGLAAPRLAARLIQRIRAALRPSDNYHTRCRGMDVGARISAREVGAGLAVDSEESPRPDTAAITYFQSRDVIKYAKVIERRLLASVLDFLEDQGVDVSEYRQRMVSILNVGAINYGSGNVTVSNSAIGEGATANNT